MGKLRLPQREQISHAIDFMTGMLWSQIEPALKANPNTTALVRYTDEEKYDNYKRAKAVWDKMQEAPEEERIAFLQGLGVEGSKYKNASNNHTLEDDETYIFFFPVKNKATLRLCLQSIMETKAIDPEARDKTFYAGAFLLDNNIKAKYINPHDKDGGVGGGDYTVGGKLVHLEEIALNTRDFDPNSLISASITEDIFLRSAYVADSREIEMGDISTLRDVAVEDGFADVRDFCDYMAAAHGINLGEEKKVLDSREISRMFKIPLEDVESMISMGEMLEGATKEQVEEVKAFYAMQGQGKCFEYIRSGGQSGAPAKKAQAATPDDDHAQDDDYTQDDLQEQ